MDQGGEFASCTAITSVVKLSCCDGDLLQKFLKACRLPHERTARVFNGKKNVVAVAKGGKLTGDTIQKIGLANSVCVNTREGRQAVGVLIGA